MSDDRMTSGRAYRRLFWLSLSALGVLIAISVAAAFVGSSPASAAAWHSLAEHRRSSADHHERIAHHAEFISERLLHKVDASDEQQERIQQIVDRELAALFALRGDSSEGNGEDHRQQWLELFRADTIDATAIEALRSEHLALADRVSAQLAQALIEVAEVLTPEQRQELLDMAERHREGRMFGRHRWH